MAKKEEKEVKKLKNQKKEPKGCGPLCKWAQ